jgi:hypothetical protein
MRATERHVPHEQFEDEIFARLYYGNVDLLPAEVEMITRKRGISAADDAPRQR